MAWALIRITTTFPLLSGIPSNDLMDKFKITKKKKKHTHTQKTEDLVPKVVTGKRKLRPLLEENCTLVDQFDIKTG